MPDQQQEVVLTYADLCAQVLQKPPTNGPNGRAWQQVCGGAMDTEFSRLFYARACRFPTQTPTDALLYLADERKIDRMLLIGQAGVQEPETTHRLRLKHAWTVWGVAGSQQGTVDEFDWMGVSTAQVLRRVDFSTPPPIGNLWVRTFAQQVWAQFDIMVRRPMPIAPLIWGAWTWGAATWGTSLTLAEIEQIRRTVRRYKSGHDTATYLYLAFTTGALWGTFTWGASGITWGGSGDVVGLIIGEKDWATRGIM